MKLSPAACLYAARWLARQLTSGGRVDFHRKWEARFAKVCPESEESIYAAYRMISDQQNNIITWDALGANR